MIPQIVKVGIEDIYFIGGEDLKLFKYYNMHFKDEKTTEKMYPNRWYTYEVVSKIISYDSIVIDIKSAIDFGCGSGAWLKAIKDICPGQEYWD